MRIMAMKTAPLPIRVIRLIIMFCACLQYTVAFAASKPIAVLYPEIREPYNQIFVNITSGIKKENGSEVYVFRLKKDTDIEEVKRWLTRHQISAAITLGSKGFIIAKELVDLLPVVVGAVRTAAEKGPLNGISMIPDPKIVLLEMKQLTPKINKVHFIYNPNKQKWLLPWMKAAEQVGIELMAHTAKDLSESASQYRDLLRELNPNNEAIWLVSNPLLMDPAIMADILEQAWEGNLTVFSSKMTDVKRGALFAMYPDNHAMGSSLAKLLAHVSQYPTHQPEIVLLTDTLITINLRTAKHLGLYFSKTKQLEFDLIYPLQ